MDSIIRIYSEGAYSIEIHGGRTLHSAMEYCTEDRTGYYSDIRGKSILSLNARKSPELFQEFEEKSGIPCSEVDIIMPYQANKTLPFIISRLGILAEKYVDRARQHGSMASASTPYVLRTLLEEGRIREGDRVLLCGTAVELTRDLPLLQL